MPFQPSSQEASHRAEYHRYFVMGGFGFGLGIGLVLRMVTSLSCAFGWGFETSRPDLVEVHGQVQMWGLLALFIMGMTLLLGLWRTLLAGVLFDVI